MSQKRNRVLLPIGLPKASPQEPRAFDVPSLFLHLLLFETVIIPTSRLEDVAAIVRTVGFKQTMELLEAGCLYIRSPMDQLGTYRDDEPDECNIVYIFTRDPEQTLSLYLQSISKIGLGRPNRDRLKKAIVDRWLASADEEPYMLDAVSTAERDAIDRSPTFMAALDIKLAEAGHTPIRRDQISAERIGKSSRLKFRVDGASWTPALTKAVRAATVGIAELEAQFGHMDRDNAVGGIMDDSLAIMERKVQALWEELRPGERVEQFYRVQSIAELPDFGEWLRDPGLDMKRFLEVRQTAECREFREFVSWSASMSDDELRARTTSLRAKIGDRVKSNIGKALRVIGTTAAGLIPGVGPVLGPAASAADTFLVEKVFPSQGIISFIGSQYPSIFM